MAVALCVPPTVALKADGPTVSDVLYHNYIADDSHGTARALSQPPDTAAVRNGPQRYVQAVQSVPFKRETARGYIRGFSSFVW